MLSGVEAADHKVVSFETLMIYRIDESADKIVVRENVYDAIKAKMPDFSCDSWSFWYQANLTLTTLKIKADSTLLLYINQVIIDEIVIWLKENESHLKGYAFPMPKFSNHKTTLSDPIISAVDKIFRCTECECKGAAYYNSPSRFDKRIVVTLEYKTPSISSFYEPSLTQTTFGIILPECCSGWERRLSSYIPGM